MVLNENFDAALQLLFGSVQVYCIAFSFSSLLQSEITPEQQNIIHDN